ncbi:hypothetical protein BDW59DRAFT_142025 [Aspergillus cavernicola]|uniref:Uncharacterized protein n=1 Tax=Aspergillus cavernicola TaxID=176166 RepID=A0ABR4IPV0_9EURO
MSCTRPPNLQKWSSLQRRSPIILTSPSRLTSLSITHPPSKPNNNPRPFHTTPNPYKAVPSPAMRKAAQRNKPRRPVFSSDALLGNRPEGNLEQRLSSLNKTGVKLLAEMLHDGIIDKSITPKIFKRVGTALLEKAYSQPASAEAVTSIAQETNVDVDTIYEIGRIITRDDKALSQWVVSSCTHAGARMALFLTATVYLRSCQDHHNVFFAQATSFPVVTSFLSQVEALAMRSWSITVRDGKSKAEIKGELESLESEGEETPAPDLQAMVIYAKYLGLRKRYLEAFALVDEVMQHIYPSKLQQRPREDLTISSRIEPPWELYLWLRRAIRVDIVQTSDNIRLRQQNSSMGQDEIEVIRLAALEFQDPEALLRYAGLMGRCGMWDMYEECMGKAAAGGVRNACRKLAHYYYLTSIGQFSRLMEHEAMAESEEMGVNVDMDAGPTEPEKPEGLLATVSSYFRPRPTREYRALAIEWYHAALAHGCITSGIQLAILKIQDGNINDARKIFEGLHWQAKTPPNLRSTIQKISEAFDSGRKIRMRTQYFDL